LLLLFRYLLSPETFRYTLICLTNKREVTVLLCCVVSAVFYSAHCGTPDVD